MANTAPPAPGRQSAPTRTVPDAGVPHRDVVIVGAGLSGVGAAHRLQTQRPGTSYAVLEAREALGGTWDLFRYPGVRSDSDMYTLGYSFKPWKDGKSLADGSSILEYIRETAEESGVGAHIEYSSKVVAADFDTGTARWTIAVEDVRSGTLRSLTCGFLYSCAGYFDYQEPHAPGFAGTDSFSGTIVHPQFWPEDLDYSGKRVVVVGSGATAVTLLPSMLMGDAAAGHITMLQRTPTWISAVPRRDTVAERINAALPEGIAHRVNRVRKIAFSTAFYQYCRRWPGSARKLLTGMSTKILGDPAMVAEHFTPSYNPWDQRLCAVPGGDLFKAIKSGQASVVTDHVDRFVPEGILLRSGKVIEADIIVTATGLKLLAFGGIEPHVDGVRVELSEQYVWNGAMMTGVPNFAICIGYTNASWTLRADLTHRLVCKVLSWMDRQNYAAVVPRANGRLSPRPLLDLASGYVQRSISAFPRQGNLRPWKVRQNYVLDSITTLRTNFGRTLVPVRPAAEGARPANAAAPAKVRA